MANISCMLQLVVFNIWERKRNFCCRFIHAAGEHPIEGVSGSCCCLYINQGSTEQQQQQRDSYEASCRLNPQQLEWRQTLPT